MEAGPACLCVAEARSHRGARARPEARAQRLAGHVVRRAVGDMSGGRMSREAGAGGSGGVLVERQAGDGPRARVDAHVAPGAQQAAMGGAEARAVLRASLSVGRLLGVRPQELRFGHLDHARGRGRGLVEGGIVRRHVQAPCRRDGEDGEQATWGAGIRSQGAIRRPPPRIMLRQGLLPTRRCRHCRLETIRQRCLQRRQGGRRPQLRRAAGELAQEIGPARRWLRGQGRQARVKGMDGGYRQEENGAHGQRVKVGVREGGLAQTHS